MKKYHFSRDIRQKLEYLYALDGKGIKPGLSRVQAFLDRIGNPHEKLTAIHVAGTNGKGSTCAIIASVLQAAGYNVGLYTSPHLVRFNERIRVNGKKISDAEIAGFLDGKHNIIEELDTSFFETTTAMAFDYFVRKKVDIAVLETGLGGRLDATNVITPLVSVITAIGKDHEKFLGNTIEKIALEKAGIIKPGVPVISARQAPVVLEILKKEALSKNCPFIYSPDMCRIQVNHRCFDRQELSISVKDESVHQLKFALLGDHQLVNLETAITVLRQIQQFKVNFDSMVRGIAATRWHGRLELLSGSPVIYYDVGHNEHGIRQVVRTLQQIFPEDKFRLLIALGGKKKVDSLGQILADLTDRVYVSEIPNGKSFPARELANRLARGLSEAEITVEPNISKALTHCVQTLKSEEHLLILGSHYIAPAIYDFFKINV